MVELSLSCLSICSFRLRFSSHLFLLAVLAARVRSRMTSHNKDRLITPTHGSEVTPHSVLLSMSWKAMFRLAAVSVHGNQAAGNLGA